MYLNDPNCTYSRNHYISSSKLSSAKSEIMSKNVQQLCFILGLQLEKLYFVFIKLCALLEVLCVYLNSHCIFFFYLNIVAMSSFMLLIGQNIWLFLVLHVSK